MAMYHSQQKGLEQTFDGGDNSDDEDYSGRRNSSSEVHSNTTEWSDEGSNCNSLNGVDGLEYLVLNDFCMKMYFKDPESTVRQSRERKAKNKDISMKREKQRGKERGVNGRRHKEETGEEVHDKDDEVDSELKISASPDSTPSAEFFSSTTVLAAPSATASPPPSLVSQAPQQESLKIGCTSHFRSLKSKPVTAAECENSIEVDVPVKSYIVDCPKDRQEFYRIFSTLIRMGSSEKKSTDDCNFTRPVRILNQQKSHEELVWQNKLNDLLWLELRAWHNGWTIEMEDQTLCQEREAIENVLNKVMNFKFSAIDDDYRDYFSSPPPDFPNDLDAASPMEVEEGEDKKLKLNVKIDLKAVGMEGIPSYPCSGYCSVFCSACIANQNEALRQVSEVLDKLDNVERLYPSSRAMTKEWEIYKDTHFIHRVQTMCLFYNLVTDLRQKIASLGKMLQSLGGENLPWPSFHTQLSNTSEKSGDEGGDLCGPVLIENVELESEKRERKSSKCVRFRCSGSSSASSGADSGIVTASPNSTPLPTISSPRHLSVNPWSFDVNLTTSTPNKSPTVLCHSISEGSLDSSFMSPYRRYVDKVLKQKGLKKLLFHLIGLIQETLDRAKRSLKMHTINRNTASPELMYFDYHSMKHEKWKMGGGFHTLSHASSGDESAEDLSSHGPFSDHYRNMELPSFRALYLFLLQIPIEIMHECIQLRLEQQPEEPSALSIRQLMRECKETIKAAVVIRLKYVKMNQVVLFKHEQEKLEQDLTDYDDNVKKMLQSYLRYLQSWVRMLLKSELSCNSQQHTEKNVLEEEWAFIKSFSRYVQRGETLASEIFCSMASLMLDSAGLYLESGVDNCTSKLYERILSDADTSQRSRTIVLQSYRDYKEVFHEARGRAMKAMMFAKMLRKDLEIAAEYNVRISSDELLEQLFAANHVLLVAPHSSTYCIFIPEHIKRNLSYLSQLLSMTYGHESSAAPYNVASEGYLLIMCCDKFGLQLDSQWKGERVMIEATAEITITLTHLKVEGLLFVVNHSSQMKAQKKIFQKAMGSSVTITKEYTTCNQSIADSLCDLKKEAMSLRDKINDAISCVEDKLNLEGASEIEDAERTNLPARYREILYQCYKFGFEYHKEITYLVTGETRKKLGLELIRFAEQWMKFVIEKCERGRGVRPRWANQGLDFLITACEPHNIKLLSSEEFLNLKQRMNTCITHLIGSADTKSAANNIGSRPGSRSHSPTPHSRTGSFRHNSSFHNFELPRSLSKLEIISKINDLNSSIEENGFSEHHKSQESIDVDLLTIDSQSSGARLSLAMRKLECEREQKLRRDGVIGKVVDKVVENSFQISARRVTFRWQRGIKLGQGRFGKVYTAVNSNTGELMALKEIHLQPNDHKTIKEVAEELRIFEGIRNPHLVRYYGIEIHREEMFIFMEYCENGTLESVLQLALPEPQIRKYTRQLLLAASVLHEHGIVHRDIKGANIFLTSDGNLKLGDFGCCIKLKNHSTMPGEVSSFVGTQAYMAPEVFTKSVAEGQGRASDIWSLGCVVVEMAQGKRPWWELENHYQIMYKVGMGETPEIPENLSEEGQDFLGWCFRFQPRERWTAIQLLGHPFTKVYSEEDYQSMPFHLS